MLINWTWIHYSNKKYLPMKTGIYSISISNKIIYIGKSKNIHSRIYSHSMFIKKISGSSRILIGYYLTNEINNYEVFAISKLNPKYNQSHCNSKYRTRYYIKIKKLLNGKPIRWLAMKINMPENDLIKKLHNRDNFLSKELKKINSILKSNIKYNKKSVL